MIIDENIEIKFTEVVFAVGSIGPFPGNSSRISSEDIKAQYVELSEAIKKSENIVIIGGKLDQSYVFCKFVKSIANRWTCWCGNGWRNC